MVRRARKSRFNKEYKEEVINKLEGSGINGGYEETVPTNEYVDNLEDRLGKSDKESGNINEGEGVVVLSERELKKKRKRIQNKPLLISPFSRRLLRVLIITYTIVLVLGLGFGVIKFKEYVKDAPKLDKSKLVLTEPSVLLDSSGGKIMDIGYENRKVLKKSEVSDILKGAITSVEDRRFYNHHGFDAIRIGKAVELSLRGRFGEQGGSTLTQQLVKLTYLDQNEDSLKRKAHEVYLSWKMEGEYSKDEILTQYINTVYLGNGVYGMRTGAEYYYGKDISKLSIPQLALIVGIPNSPENYNPYSNLDRAKYRRDVVLLSMRDTGLISSEEYKKYKGVSIKEGLKANKGNYKLNEGNDEYATYINEAKREAYKIVGNRLYTDKLEVRTNLDKGMQEYAYKLVHSNSEYMYNNNKLMTSFVAIDNKTGRVLMMEGGNREIKPEINGFNFVTDIKKQPGSSIKPILAYAPALEHLGWLSTTRIVDEPTVYNDGTPFVNYDHNYLGNITLEMGLITSRNVPAVKTMRAVGYKKAYKFAEDVGMGIPEDQRYESSVLGSVSNANPYKMGGAFTTFANKGVYREPHVIVSIKDKEGKELYNEGKGKRVMRENSALEMDKMLRGVVTSPYGTGGELRKSKYNVRGKTGTTNFSDEEMISKGLPNRSAPDIWFVGYDDKYTVAVWNGYDSRDNYIPLEGQKVAQELSLKIFESLHRGGK